MVKIPRAARMAVVAGFAALGLLGAVAGSASAAPASVSSKATASAPATQLYCAWQVIENTVLITASEQVLPLTIGKVVYGVPPTSGKSLWAYSPFYGTSGAVWTGALAVVSCNPIPGPS
jgi:hypothetical protein